MSKTTKTLITKILLTLIIFTVIVLAMVLIVKKTGVTNIEELQAVVENAGAWGWLVFLLIQVLVTTFLCFVPGLTITFITAGILLFGPFNALILSLIGVILTSTNLFFIGDKLGEKVAIWLVGEENLKKAQDIYASKSSVLLPITFMLPLFPDNAMCIVAGMSKMNYWHFILIAFIFRGIVAATMVFLGSGAIDYSSLPFLGWFLIVNALVIGFICLVKIARKLENVIKRKIQKNIEK